MRNLPIALNYLGVLIGESIRILYFTTFVLFTPVPERSDGAVICIRSIVVSVDLMTPMLANSAIVVTFPPEILAPLIRDKFYKFST